MSDNANKVRHIIEVDPGEWTGGASNEPNDYLGVDGWMLLGTGTHTGTGDHGQWASIYYSFGWIGEGEPDIPPAGPMP